MQNEGQSGVARLSEIFCMFMCSSQCLVSKDVREMERRLCKKAEESEGIRGTGTKYMN